MSILDREREIAHTQNQIKHSTCTVYTASPEELEQLLNGRNGMGRQKGSKNKPHDITINEKRQALQNKIEKQKSEREEKKALNNGAFANIDETHELERVIGKSSDGAGIQIIPMFNMQPEACLVQDGKDESNTAAVTAEYVGRSKEIADEINQIASQKPWLNIPGTKSMTPLLTLNEKLDNDIVYVNDAELDEPSEIHQRCMSLLKQKHKLACIEAAHKLISDETRCLGIENSVETLSNIIEIAMTIRKELLVQ